MLFVPYYELRCFAINRSFGLNRSSSINRCFGSRQKLQYLIRPELRIRPKQQKCRFGLSLSLGKIVRTVRITEFHMAVNAQVGDS